jgi:magnesium chelatase subunit D
VPGGIFGGGLWADGGQFVEAGSESVVAAAEALDELGELSLGEQKRIGRTSGRSRRRSMARSRVSERPFSGQYVRAVPADGKLQDLAWIETLRAAAHLQKGRRVPGAPLVQLRSEELMRKLRTRRPERLLLLVVDASGSMGGVQTKLAKRVALTVLENAYVERDWVAMVGFRERSARLLFEPTNRIERVHESLKDLGLGGTTPLAAGLRLARQTLVRDARCNGREQRVILVTDGKANVGAYEGYPSIIAEVEYEARALRRLDRVPILFLDTTEAGKRDMDARLLAEHLGAERISLAHLQRAGRDPVGAINRRLH